MRLLLPQLEDMPDLPRQGLGVELPAVDVDVPGVDATPAQADVVRERSG